MFPRSNQISVDIKDLILDLSQEHLQYLYYIKSMTITFLQLTRNNIIGSKIISPLMLNYQRKKYYYCLWKKTFLKCKMTEHRD